jgi:DNA-binding CsgD family transcriptional regulator
MEQVSELLADREGHTFPGRERMTAEAVHRLTAGNPLFVGELVRHLESETTSETDRSAWLSRLVAAELPSVPPALTEVVERRLDALPSLARSILSQAAVLGLQFDFDVLAEMADLEEDVLLDALGDAAHAEILFEARDGVADFEFRHEIVRQVLYTNLSRPRRQRMHLRAAQALESVYAASVDLRLGEISHHYRAAGRRADQRRTAEYSLRAAMRAQDVFAYPEAVEHLRIALAAFEESGGSIRERADVLDRMAGILYVSGGSRDLGIQCAERALRLYEQLGEHQRIAQAHSRLMWQFSSYPEVVDMPRARAQFEAAKGILGDDRDRMALGYFFIGQAGAALWEVRTPEGLEASNQALGVAERLGDQALWASAAGMRGWHLAISGRLRQGRELLERAWQAADTKGHFIWSFRAAWYHGTLTFLLADPWESCTWLQRELARPHLDAALLQKRSLLERLGHSLIAIGDMERAAAVAQELGPGNIVSAHLQYRAGEWEAAMEGFVAAQARVVRAGDAFDEWLINHRIASVASALGETGTAVAVLSRNLEISADGATTLEAFTRIRMAMVVAPASADCADGHMQRAVELLHDGEDWRGLGGQVAMAKGAVAAARGERTEAIGELEAALREFERLRIPWEVAEARLRLAALGVPEADEHLRLASEIHERCGTPGFWARRVATISPAMKGTAMSNSHGLSGREVEVLALLGRGLSNKEIADELVISPHTVAKHVSAILAKTGVRSRSGAAALAISEGAILPQ